MISIDCPICGSKVDGEAEYDLSVNLQDHVRENHSKILLCDLSKADGKKACKPSRSGEMEKVPYERRMSEEAHRSKGVQYPGEDVMMSVRCPVCGDTVLGHAYEDFSFNLAEHMKWSHDVRKSRR